MGASKNKSLRIGIQGVRASFHEVAARKFFPNVIQPIECASFSRLSEVLKNKDADLCVMAIENSIAGSILTNYSLMESNGFKIVGEVYLRIEMNLMALPGQKIKDIHSVQSHPMALLQCSDFLAEHPHMSVVEATDTADSAKLIAKKKLKNHAAIASALAAEAYDLEILEAGIESNKQNYTRFLVICRKEDYKRPHDANKASIRFESAHKPGSLAAILDVFSKEAVNMTKIQSVPILGRPYEYSFHVDLEWEDFDRYQNALEKLKNNLSLVSNLIHFGNYPQGERPLL